MAKTIQLKRGTAAILASVNPKPARGETIVEIDTGKMKVGDGTKSWNDLPYTDAGNVKASAISSEAANDGKFSTEAAQGDAETLVNMGQLRTLQSAIDAATHDVSGEIVDANGAATAAGANDATTGVSVTAAKALATRIKTLEDDDVVDGGEITE